MADLKDPRALTRSELAKFLPNQRAIKAFEKLFDSVPSGFNISSELIQEALIDAGIADTKATQAIDGLVSTTRRLKSNEVLIWLSM